MGKVKYHICLDLEMSELTFSEQGSLPISKEVIQIGAALLNENYKFIDGFSIYVKPRFSHITKKINDLTGISEEMISDKSDFVSSFEKYIDWIERSVGNEEFVTYCWSLADYNQLKSEIYLKAKERTDFLENISTFVDLQRTFSEVLGTQRPIALDKAIEFCHENFEGQEHTADADAFNTAVILHKLCLGKFNTEFHYIHQAEIEKIEKEKEEEKRIEQSFNSSFASFVDPKLLEKFGINKDEQIKQDEKKLQEMKEDYSSYLPPKLSKREKKLLKLQQKEEKKKNLLSPEIRNRIANSHPSLKYNIQAADWMLFFARMIRFRAKLR